MKLSDLITELFRISEFTSVNSLADYSEQTQPFTDAFINSKKAARGKEDAIFDAITSDVSVEEFIAALELVRAVKRGIIERDQIL